MSRRPGSWIRWTRVPPWSWWDPPEPPAGPLGAYVPAPLSNEARRALDLAHTLGLRIERMGFPSSPLWRFRGFAGVRVAEHDELPGLTFDTLSRL